MVRRFLGARKRRGACPECVGPTALGAVGRHGEITALTVCLRCGWARWELSSRIRQRARVMSEPSEASL